MMRLKWPTYLCIAILILGITGCAINNRMNSGEIRASGFIEGRTYSIASGQGGQVVEVRVRQGDHVKAGDVLVVLDAAYLESAHAQAQASVDAAQAAIDAFQGKPTERELAEAEAALKRSEAELDAAQADRDLLLSSYEPENPPEMELNATESAIDVAEAGVALAKAQLDQVKAGPLEEEREIFEARLKEAQANLRLVKRQLDDLKFVAPIDGVVSQVLRREGEVVSQGFQAVYLMDPGYLSLKLFIPVEQVAKIDIGDEFEITADAYPDQVFSASVIHIADEAQFTPATVLTQEERVKLVFAVELLIDDPSGKLKPGMPVDAFMQD